MDTGCNLNLEYDRKNVVADFIKTKTRTTYYAVTYRRYYCDDLGYDDFMVRFLKEFNHEQMELVKEILTICQEERIDINEAIGNHDEKYEFLQQYIDSAHYYLVPEKIDLKTKYHQYRFRYGYFVDSIEEQPRIIEVKVNLADEEYKALLEWRLKHLNAGFVSLRHDHPELFEKLATRFDAMFSSIDWVPPHYACTYVIEMTEVNEDVDEIIKKYGSKL